MSNRSITQFMNPSNVYWAAPQYTRTFLKPISGNPGFLMNLPYPDPVSGQMYSGEGRENIYGLRELVYTTLPEIYAIGNILPTTGGVPRVDPTSVHARHSREAFTRRI